MQNACCHNARFGVVLLTLCLACSCMKEAAPPIMPADVEQTNGKRQTIGIRLIKPDWVLGRTEFGAEDWLLNTNRASFCKRVQRDSHSVILWEEDYYPSGKTYTTFDGTCTEELVIHYDYGKRLYFLHYLGTNDVSAKIAEPFREGTHDVTALTRVADTILVPWGLSRL